MSRCHCVRRRRNANDETSNDGREERGFEDAAKDGATDEIVDGMGVGAGEASLFVLERRTTE